MQINYKKTHNLFIYYTIVLQLGEYVDIIIKVLLWIYGGVGRGSSHFKYTLEVYDIALPSYQISCL